MDSGEARRLVEQAVGSIREGRSDEAHRLIDAALAKDSTLALAWYYAAELAPTLHDRRRLWGAALRHAATAPAGERLRVLVEWARLSGDPSQVAYAESLRALAPDAPESHLQAGLAKRSRGDLLASVPDFERALADAERADSAIPGGCAACVAHAALADTWALIDSLPALEREVRRWISAVPRDHRAWAASGWLLSRTDRSAEALPALQRAMDLRGIPWDSSFERFEYLLTAGDFDAAQRALAGTGVPVVRFSREDALWWRGIALRQQGRAREALAVADSLNQPNNRLVHRAVALLEMGRARDAYIAFDSAVREVSEVARWLPSVRARDGSWGFTRAATAAAAAGDTGLLPVLADTVERLGNSSYYERDRRLHHYVRGLLLAARGDTAGAIQSYRGSIWLPSQGYTRANLELARLLIAARRPTEAIPVLRSALHGGFSAANLYVTRTELYEQLAQAHRAAGATDSASVHYARVASAWKSGDAPFRARAEAALRRARVRAADPAASAR